VGQCAKEEGMAKSTWYNPFSWGAKDPEIVTQTVTDPAKTGVSSPLSSYLAGGIGKGLPAYSGNLTEELDPQAYNRYQEFISLDPGAWFDKAVGDPSTKKFKEDFMPELTESFAGNLRGSGRYSSALGAMTTFSDDLAAQREKAMVSIPQEQFKMASEYKAQKDADYLTQYNAWMKTLPEFNPVIGQALSFLQGPTGTDTLSYLAPGQKGWFVDAAKIVTDLIDAVVPG
jgi:hypothetical protein